MQNKKLNFVIIMTDTQNKSMVGAYGKKEVDTPNLDRLASGGIRFERAYTASPVCTPARGSIFSGLHPQVNGAYANCIAPHSNIKMMGTIFKEIGYRVAYTGKWHLDGSFNYMGSGSPDGGFEPDWWYDGTNYLEDIGPAMAKNYGPMAHRKNADDLRKEGFTRDNIWGKRVADRAVNFLENIKDDPFVLVASFDEPHQPYFAPPEYWDKFSVDDIRRLAPRVEDDLASKPEIQKTMHNETYKYMFKHLMYDDIEFRTKFYGCNSYIDLEIGRVLDAVTKNHGEDTVIIYTSDHGDMLGSHGLYSKGPMMYEEICNIPFIIKAPGAKSGSVSNSLVSHLDIIPTMLDMSGSKPYKSYGISSKDLVYRKNGYLLPYYDFHGRSLVPILINPDKNVRDYLMINFNRSEIVHEMFGEFYPIRCATDGRHKLVVNLFETDEFYDLKKDPYEVKNRIDDNTYIEVRNRMHEWLLDEMKKIADPFRSFRWGDRPWNSIAKRFYWLDEMDAGMKTK